MPLILLTVPIEAPPPNAPRPGKLLPLLLLPLLLLPLLREPELVPVAPRELVLLPASEDRDEGRDEAVLLELLSWLFSTRTPA